MDSLPAEFSFTVFDWLAVVVPKGLKGDLRSHARGFAYKVPIIHFPEVTHKAFGVTASCGWHWEVG